MVNAGARDLPRASLATIQGAEGELQDFVLGEKQRCVFERRIDGNYDDLYNNQGEFFRRFTACRSIFSE